MEYGVQGRLLKWIWDYLSNRTAHVPFNGACSTPGCYKWALLKVVISVPCCLMSSCTAYSLPSLLSPELQLLAMQMTFVSTLTHHKIYSSSSMVLSSPHKVQDFLLSQPENTPRLHRGKQGSLLLLTVPLLRRASTSHHDRPTSTKDPLHCQGPTTAALLPRQMTRQ